MELRWNKGGIQVDKRWKQGSCASCKKVAWESGFPASRGEGRKKVTRARESDRDECDTRKKGYGSLVWFRNVDVACTHTVYVSTSIHIHVDIIHA